MMADPQEHIRSEDKRDEVVAPRSNRFLHAWNDSTSRAQQDWSALASEDDRSPHLDEDATTNCKADGERGANNRSSSPTFSTADRSFRSSDLNSGHGNPESDFDEADWEVPCRPEGVNSVVHYVEVLGMPLSCNISEELEKFGHVDSVLVDKHHSGYDATVRFGSVASANALLNSKIFKSRRMDAVKEAKLFAKEKFENYVNHLDLPERPKSIEGVGYSYTPICELKVYGFPAGWSFESVVKQLQSLCHLEANLEIKASRKCGADNAVILTFPDWFDMQRFQALVASNPNLFRVSKSSLKTDLTKAARNCLQIFINRIPITASPADVRKAFQDLGTLDVARSGGVNIIQSSSPRFNSAFIHYASPEDVLAVMEYARFNLIYVGGFAVLPTIYDPNHGKGANATNGASIVAANAGANSVEPSTSSKPVPDRISSNSRQPQLFVGKIPKAVNQFQLEKVFKGFGPLASKGVDMRTGTNHHYAFIRFVADSSASAVLRVQQRMPININGNPVYVIRYDPSYVPRHNVPAGQGRSRDSPLPHDPAGPHTTGPSSIFAAPRPPAAAKPQSTRVFKASASTEDPWDSFETSSNKSVYSYSKANFAAASQADKAETSQFKVEPPKPLFPNLNPNKSKSVEQENILESAVQTAIGLVKPEPRPTSNHSRKLQVRNIANLSSASILANYLQNKRASGGKLKSPPRFEPAWNWAAVEFETETAANGVCGKSAHILEERTLYISRLPPNSTRHLLVSDLPSEITFDRLSDYLESRSKQDIELSNSRLSQCGTRGLFCFSADLNFAGLMAKISERPLQLRDGKSHVTKAEMVAATDAVLISALPESVKHPDALIYAIEALEVFAGGVDGTVRHALLDEEKRTALIIFEDFRAVPLFLATPFILETSDLTQPLRLPSAAYFDCVDNFAYV